MNTETALRRLLAVMDELREASPDMGVQTVATFIMVALEPGITVTELQAKLGLTQSAASRNWTILSTRKSKVRITEGGKQRTELRPGLGLITDEEDPMDRRRVLLRPTLRGTTVMNKIASALSG